MQKHTKIYMDYHGYSIADFIECKVCSKQATEIHHIDNKGMGGSKTKDYPLNLIALCRQCHIDAHDEKISKEYLKSLIHVK